MKKTSYHVNPAVNKWEEEQRRARMEKMIQRAKSTLPPEARGGAKNSGPKKPSPYTAENNASKLVRKRSTTGGQGTPSGAIAVDAQELDSLIYNRVQEILHMPLMRRAAAAKAALKGSAPQRTPPSARGARRPQWNNDWNAQTASAPAGQEERPVRAAVAPRAGAAPMAHERSPTKAASANARAFAPQGQTASPSKTTTTTKTTRSPGPPQRLDIPGSRGGTGAMQRQASGRTQAAGLPEERVVLLPSPSGPTPAYRSGIPRPSSSRYGSSAGAVGSNGAEAQSGHQLEHSVVATIEALNPQAGAAREAAGRIAHHQQTQRGQRTERSPSGSLSTGPVPGGAAGVPGSGSFRGSSDGGAATRLGGSTVSGGGAGQSLMAASQGGSPGMTNSSAAGVPGRPPLAPGVRASGRDGPHGGHHRGAEAKRHESDDEYADDDFEEYEGSEDEGGGVEAGRDAEAEEGGDGGDGEEEGPAAVGQAAALLRESVNALNGLVQLKIQQELARSQQAGQQAAAEHTRRSQADGAATGPGSGRSGAPTQMLASLALVGSEESDARHGHRRGDLASSSLGDGLRQSDLEYLARLGAGEPHEGDVANSTDERFVIEPGAPAGTAKAWGDRQPWSTEKAGTGTTGLDKLRARQEQEKTRQDKVGAGEPAGGQRRSQAGAADERRSRQPGQEPASQQEGGRGWNAAAGDEEDSVLLGETLTPRQRTGAVAQMAAVGDALAALASSGHLDVRDAKDLRAQTDALFGSLVQLHNLMTGPRGAELCSSSPTTARGDGGAEGFSPMILSPIDSPDQSLKRPVADASPDIRGTADGGRCRPKRMDVARAGELDDCDGADRKPVDGALPGQGAAGTHLQLTPKHCLVAEDVAWMAGLVHSLSRSLHVENGEVELPRM